MAATRSERFEPDLAKAAVTWQGVPVLISRRTTLGGLGSLGLGSLGLGSLGLGSLGLVSSGLVGCSGQGESDGAVITTTDAGAAIREEVIGAEAALVARYSQAIAALPDLTGALTPIREQHLAHALAMGASNADSGALPDPQPSTATEILQGLIEAERQAVGARTASCVGAPEIELARVLALIAASEASHLPYLTRLAGGQWP